MTTPQRPILRVLPLGDGVHVQAHRGHLAAAVLVELVATGLAPEAVEEELVAEVTVGQLEEGLADLGGAREREHERHSGWSLKDKSVYQDGPTLLNDKTTFSSGSGFYNSP